MTDREDAVDVALSVVHGAASAMSLVETVDEAWLYREAAQSRAKRCDAVSQSILHKPDADPQLLVHDCDSAQAWIQGDFMAVGR